jgi:hypothetical protein
LRFFTTTIMDTNTEDLNIDIIEAAQEAADTFLTNNNNDNNNGQEEAEESKMEATEDKNKPDDADDEKAAAEADGGEEGQQVKEDDSSSPSSKPSKKRIRRVGKFAPDKIPKLGESPTPEAVAAIKEEQNDEKPDGDAPEGETEDVINPEEVIEPPGVTGEETATANPSIITFSAPSSRVVTKHDEKWGAMYDKLIEYKKQNGNTMVPQCFHEDPRLGRWVHYQR